MKQIWRPIKGYEGLYEISNFGVIKSLERICKTGNGLGEHFLPERILSVYKHANGYMRVCLSKNKKRKNYLVHRLVAEAFLPNPDNKPFINHIDCNRQNNCVDNIEWCTQKENMQHASKLGRMKGGENLKKVSSEQRKINGKKVCKPVIAINLKTGKEIYCESQSEAAKQLNLGQSNINKVLKGKYKQYKGYTFRYVE